MHKHVNNVWVLKGKTDLTFIARKKNVVSLDVIMDQKNRIKQKLNRANIEKETELQYIDREMKRRRN